MKTLDILQFELQEDGKIYISETMDYYYNDLYTIEELNNFINKLNNLILKSKKIQFILKNKNNNGNDIKRHKD